MSHRVPRLPLALVAVVTGLAATVALSGPAGAVATPVTLGTAGSFAVLAGSTVTNTGPTIVTADLGVSPGSAVTGFPPGVVTGSIHAADADVAQAQVDLTAAYNDAAGQTADASVAGDIGGQTLTPGVYNSSSSLSVTGTLTLDGQGDPNAVFVIQVGSSLVTASASTVNLINGAAPCNVFWQVGSSATLGTGSTFAGSILALTSITATTGVAVDGQLLARNGAVTLDSGTISHTACPPAVTTTTAAPTTTTTIAVTTTVPTPTTEVETPTTDPVTTAPSTTVPPSTPAEPTDELPRTGSSVTVPAALAGFLAVLLGGLMIVRSRRAQPS
jgi:LPXTG-motif cell wall-anchored protein